MKLKITSRSIASTELRTQTYDIRDTELPGFIARVRPSGTISYIVQYRDSAGVQQSYTIGQHGKGWTPITARDEAIEIRYRAGKGEDPHRDRRAARSEAFSERQNTLRSYLEGGYQHHLTHNRKPGSAAEAAKIIKRHFSAKLDQPLTAITQRYITEWRKTKKTAGLTNVTIRRVNAELSSLMNHAHRDGVIQENPLTSMRPVAVKTRDNIKPRYLSPEENSRLRAAIVERENRLKARAASGRQWRVSRGHEAADNAEFEFHNHLTPMVILSLNTGLRRGELVTLEWSDCDLEQRKIDLRPEVTKSGEPRTIPLNSEALAVLTAWRNQTASNSYVFSNNGQPFTTLKNGWGQLLKKAKIENFRWHDLRHDFASQLVIRGVPLNTVRELLGHTDIKTTLRYAHLSNEAKSDAVALLDICK